MPTDLATIEASATEIARRLDDLDQNHALYWLAHKRLDELLAARATCRSCRRARRDEYGPAIYSKTCARCGCLFETTRPTQRYCSPEHRRTAATSTTKRGYGIAHQRERRRWRPRVEAGEVECHAVVCFMPTRRIEPGTPWDLGHTIDRSGWTGPEHRYCNRKEPQLRGPGTPTTQRAQRRWVL
jgi:hypothetical protein